MPKMQLIADSFDLQRRDKLCNARGCGRLPSKQITILEEDRITNEKKSLVQLFLCTSHFREGMPPFMEKMNMLNETGKKTTTSVRDIGFVTC